LFFNPSKGKKKKKKKEKSMRKEANPKGLAQVVKALVLRKEHLK
jgi:hypothetical protein